MEHQRKTVERSGNFRMTAGQIDSLIQTVESGTNYDGIITANCTEEIWESVNEIYPNFWVDQETGFFPQAIRDEIHDCLKIFSGIVYLHPRFALDGLPLMVMIKPSNH